MVKNHLKRLNAPKTWPIERKNAVWITRPNPGSHALASGIPLVIALRDLLKYAKTVREVKKIVFNKEVTVDGTRRKDIAHIVGLMDVIGLPEVKEFHRITFDKKGRISSVKIDEKECTKKVCKVVGKTAVKGKIHIHTHDGRTFVVDKTDSKVGDSIEISVPDQKIIQTLKLEKGAKIYLMGGKYVGQVVTLDSIQDKKAIFKTDDNKVFDTAKRYIFVVGKDKPVVTLL